MGDGDVLGRGRVNETLAAEMGYFKAIGVETEYYDDEEGECEYLVSTKLRDRMFSVVWSAEQSHQPMLSHGINVEFRDNEVLAWYTGCTGYTRQMYGDAQWKSKQWAFGMAVVGAVTDKLLKGRSCE